MAGWTVSRGTHPAEPRPWGYVIQVGAPGHVARHVLPEPDGTTVRKLCDTITEPGVWLRLMAPREEVAGWITPGWTLRDDPGFLMTKALPHPAGQAAPAAPPDSYRLRTERAAGVVTVRILAPDGEPAARGQVAPTGATAVFDQIGTEAAHRRRGLGALVMGTLERAAAEAGAATGILGATVDGRALYTALGWEVRGPLTGAVRAG
ncbi:GNAT family N-acetyltransferase [Streptomyces liangshanensis]|uniref:GNAT family N-acetyltransferase n=1 Tax=Streptomyces liangshanensis TaxID=2717324 RepID=UPI0036DA212F